ncbi:MAG: hypothetical protein ABC378_00115 [Staphylococcus pseudoxylosus]|uniref:hypothetical protein n=1 Tax=Staphylococcus pseudoxylosus TaxID=2282419 RepID=UPI0031F706CF
MVKIKRKVEMTCGEFAKYMVDKFGLSSYGVKLSEDYWLGNPEREYDVSIDLPPSKISDLPDITITKSGVVIFEVEEEITEDTAFNMLVALYKYPRLQKIFSNRDNTSIRQFKDLEDDIVSAIYMVNDDSTMTLIWRDGKLVE